MFSKVITNNCMGVFDMHCICHVKDKLLCSKHTKMEHCNIIIG